jgi:CubicO group peptidase (beta-lactamase class C family)
MRSITLLAVAVAGMLPATADAQGTRRPNGPRSAIITDRASALNRRISDSMSVVLRRALADSAFPGAVAVVGNGQTITSLVTVGRLDARDSTAPTITTIYDLASLTKIVATTTVLLQLVDQGTVALDAPVVQYLPEWKGPRTDRITIRQLLTHSSGLAAWRPFYKEAADRAEARGQLMLVGPEVPPGTRYLYSDMNFMLLGAVIEQVTGMPLDSAFTARVARPLRLADTRFRPDTALRARIAPTEFDPWRQRQLRGEVHDENASRFDGVSGHAGLFSTASDLSRVVRMWLNRGTLDGVRFASERTVAEFTRAQDTLVSKRALGWETPTGGNSAGRRLSPGAFGHTGFTGTSIWVDPGRDLFVILLTNRVNPTRENRKIGGVRTALADAVAGAADGVAGKTR